MQIQKMVFPGMGDDASVTVPAQGKIRTGYLSGLQDLVHNLGGDPRQILEHEDIDPLQFQDPDHDIECIAAVNLLEYCSHLLEDPLFGLHLAERQDPDVYGCVIALARAAPDLRQALQCLVDYVQVSTSPECEMEMVVGNKVAELRWRTDIGLGERQQVNYHGLLVTMKALQMLGRERFRPSYANLSFRVGRSDIALIENSLGCRVYAKSETNAIAFPVDNLEYPLVSSNRMLFSLLKNGLDQIRTLSKAGFTGKVEATVQRLLSAGQCNVVDCAGQLGTSSRTLQKRLAQSGIKFTDIVQTERIKLAKHALLWSDCSLDEIAFQLGYSEQTSFGRAFKRSTGLTPNEFRLKERRKH